MMSSYDPMELAVADVVPAVEFMREDAQQCIAAVRGERFREPHDGRELSIGEREGRRSLR